MKKKIIIILVIIVLVAVLVTAYVLNQNSSKTGENDYNITSKNVGTVSNTEITNETNNAENALGTENNMEEGNESDEITENGTLEVGTTEQRGFIIDNVYHSENQGDIHSASYYPENYDETRDSAIYFALPGWEGLYFQGVGANMGEPYPYEAQKYVSDMIIISPQLDDWGEESADDTIALVEYFLRHYNIDESRVYISGASGGGETLSLVLGKRPELFTSALFISSQWDGDLNVLANAKTPLYIVIGENDSYYGSTRAINAYNSLHDIYENQGLSDEQIDEILVLDVKEHEYFSSQGVSDEHAGLGLFAYDEDVMSWVFNKRK